MLSLSEKLEPLQEQTPEHVVNTPSTVTGIDHKTPSNRLQCTIGNQAVMRWLQSDPEDSTGGRGVEARAKRASSLRLGQDLRGRSTTTQVRMKVAVSTPEDKYEQEADRIANLVMRMAEPKISGDCSCDSVPQGAAECDQCQTQRSVHKSTAQLKRMSSTSAQGSHLISQLPENTLQRKCGCTDASSGAGECDRCRIQQQANGTKLDFDASSSQSSDAGSAVEKVLNSPGQPLDLGTRNFMEPRFGRDFAQVRVHSDPEARASAEAVNARAYTVGSDIVMGAQQPPPSSLEALGLMAHELTHVVQQEDQASSSAILTEGTAVNSLESEAEANANEIVAAPSSGESGAAVVQRTPRPLIMRDPLFNSTMEICKRVLKSRVFKVTQSGISVTANAVWEASAAWQGREAPKCGVETYNIQLSKVGMIFDSNYGGCNFDMGRPNTRVWGSLPEGEYQLIISTNNTNPNCCLRGGIEVTQQSGVTGESCTKPPPGPIETLHIGLELAGLIPALGVFPDAINTGIYIIEGDWQNAGLSAIAIIPIFGDAASAVRIGRREILKVTGEAVERVGKDGIAKGLREARASKKAAGELAEDLGAAKKIPGAKAVAGLVGCRSGSLFCPIGFLQREFADVFAARNKSEFSRYLREISDVDLSMGKSLRREQTILTGDAMYAQFMREVPRSQWSSAFDDAVSLARRPGVDYREIVVQGQRHRWPLDDIGSPWVVHHDPPLGWVTSEGSHLWHPMPYRIHDAAHKWWTQLERAVKSRIPADLRKEILEGAHDIRDL